VLLRDLPSCVATWFALVFLFFLVSALPWTAFWGGKLLAHVEAATGQESPAGFSPGGAPVSVFSNATPSIEKVVSDARAHGVRGSLDVRLAPWRDAPLFMTNLDVAPSQDRIVTADPATGTIRGDYRSRDLPAIPRFVALGVHVHQGDFGWPNLVVNTAFALSLVWLTVTGVISWWMRRPQHSLGVPPQRTSKLPRKLVLSAILACVVLPLFGLSVACLWLADLVFGRRLKARAPAL
jgi:uncharacterized iron-regulated membrane protein